MSAPQPNAATQPTLPVMIPPAAPTPIDSDSQSSAGFRESSEPVEVEMNLGRPLEQSTSSDSVPPSWLWMNKYDQLFVGIFVAMFLGLSGYHWMTLGGWGMRPIELDRLSARKYDFRIDINSASWVEWTQIEGIGEATAQLIIADREANGAFGGIKDLLRVKGIGPKKLEMMRPFLREPDGKSDPMKAAP